MKMKRKPVKASRKPMSASARSAKARNLRKVCASIRDKEDAFEWMDFGNDILRAANKYEIKIEDYVCDPKLPEIHFLVYMMSTYEYAINIDVVGGKILIEKANAEDDYLQRYSCDSINEALGRIYDLFKSTVQFGKWTAVKSSKYNHFAKKVNASKRTGKRSIMARRSVVTEYLNFNEMTPEQQEQAINEFLDSGNAYELYSEDMGNYWEEQSKIDADEFETNSGISVNPDNLYWEESSQGPYPKWDLEKVFGEYEGTETGVEFSFGFYGSLTVKYSEIYINDESGEWTSYNYTDDLRKDGFNEIADIVEDKTREAQEFIDQIWSLIEDVCTSYPNEYWCREMLEGNDYEFQIDKAGNVVKML